MSDSGLRQSVRAALEKNMPADRAEATERAGFNYALQRCQTAGVARAWGNPCFAECYKGVSLGLLRNADRLVEAYDAGVQTPETAVYAKPHEIRPDLWADVLTRKRERDLAYGVKPKANTNMYQCRRCKSRECSYYELQTRSGDEPTTVFVTCLTCGNRWRIND